MSPSSPKSPTAPAAASNRRRVGNQLIWVEEPDVFRMQFHGTLTGEELKEIFEREDEWGRGKTYFVIADAEKLKTFSPHARQVLKTRRTRELERVTVVLYGTSFPIRIVAEMIMRARRLLGVSGLVAVFFIDNEAEAKTIVQSLRRNP